MSSTFRKYLCCLLLLASLGFIVYFFATNRAELTLLGRIQPYQVAFLALLHITSQLSNARRLQIVFKKCSERHIGYSPWFRIFILSQFLNTVIPQLGNIYRGVRLKVDHDVAYTSYITRFISFTWMGAWLNMVFALAVLIFADSALRVSGVPAWQVVLTLIVILAAGPFAIDRLIRRTPAHGRSLIWLHSKLNRSLTNLN